MTAPPLAIRRILCPTDFSVFAMRALRHAIALAQQFDARLEITHVVPGLAGLAAGSPLPDAVADLLPELRRKAEADMRRFAMPAVEARAGFDTRICEGDPWREILERAESLPADLAVLGTHGRSGFERFVLGSVTEKLLRVLPCPVMTVCHEEGRTWEAPGLVRRILCATDFAEPDTASYAMGLAARHGAALTLLHVVEDLPASAASLYVAGVGMLSQEMERVARERLADAVTELEDRFGLRVSAKLVSGNVHREILRAASDDQADLIVIGGRPRSGRFLLGSSAHHLVREATCPVLVARPVAERKPRPVATSALAVKE